MIFAVCQSVISLPSKTTRPLEARGSPHRVPSRVVVNLGSQTQYTPQALRPQSGPVMSTREAKSTASSAPAFAISAQTGNIYSGLWYAIIIALMTVVIGAIFVPNGTHKKDIFADDATR